MNLELKGIIFKDKAIITELRDHNFKETIWKTQESFDYVADTAACVEASLIPYDSFWKDPKKHSKTWHLTIPQDRIPSWFHKEHRKKFRIAADAWWAEHVLIQKEISSLSGGVYFLKNCTVSQLCGNARIICMDTRIDHMKDQATVLRANGNSIINHMHDQTLVKELNDCSFIRYIDDSARVECMDSYSNIYSLYGNAQVLCMKGHSQIFDLYQQARIVTMKDHTLVHSVSHEAVIEEMQDMSFVTGLSGNAKVNRISGNHAIIPVSNTESFMPFS